MYTNTESVQILISSLKQYGIDHIVISPGTRAMPLVHSVEQDSFFTCYSVTDERSAGYFALGIVQSLKKPVAVCCTSGTAVMNLLSATQEALFQRLPLLVLTAERPMRMLDQYPDQMVQTHELYKKICKKSVILPIIQNEKDRWRCSLSVNQVLSELEHKLKGPVNIIFQVDEHEVFNFSASTLPKFKRIERLHQESQDCLWEKKINKLNKAKRIMLVCGQHQPFEGNELKIIEDFSQKYRCVFLKDNISNLHIDKSLNLNHAITLSAADTLKKLSPEIVITFGGHSVQKVSDCIGENTEHWLIHPGGEFIDSFNKLSCVFECSSSFFFKVFSQRPLKGGGADNHDYYHEWKNIVDKYSISDFSYSDVFVVQQFLKKIPKDSLLHIGNSLSIRYSQLFDIPDSIEVSCNRGSNGIDGSLSTFIGASSVTKKLSFIIIGDLSFFYDMTGLWNRYQGKNIRILLNNNSGGMLFNSRIYWAPYNGVNKFIAAEHDATAKGWCESRGYKYLSSTNEDEYLLNLEQFISQDSDKPILFEVFTNKTENDDIFFQFVKKNREITVKRAAQYLCRRIKG